MTEPTRKKKKGRTEEITIVETHKDESSLYFVTSTGIPVDLYVFATGVTDLDIKNRRRKEKTPYTGRPDLIHDLLPVIKEELANKTLGSINNTFGALKYWWRLFDRCEEQFISEDGKPICSVVRVHDITELHYAKYREAPCSACHQQIFRRIVDRSRRLLGVRDLYWTTITTRRTAKDLVKMRDVERIYHFIKREVRGPNKGLSRWGLDKEAKPTKQEVVYLATLFVLYTGWNTSVVFRIDVTPDDTGAPSCLIPHPTSKDHQMIRSVKSRASGSQQLAMSRKGKTLSPSGIIESLCLQTRTLREELRDCLKELDRRIECMKPGREYDYLQMRRETVLKMSRSPWLYEIRVITNKEDVLERIKGIGCLLDSNVLSKRSTGGISLLDTIAAKINSGLKASEEPVSLDITLPNIRNAYIAWRYERSGYSWIDAMLAAGHRNINSLRVYLNRMQHKTFSRKEMIRATEVVWKTITEDRAFTFSPIEIAARLNDASEEQIALWKAKRTRMGMSCVNFNAPPNKIAPAHIQGTGCRIQRCILCENGIAYDDTPERYAMRAAELLHIKKNIPINVWHQSSFEDETQRIELFLSGQFPSEEVSRWITYWSNEINAGRHLVIDSEGDYES